MLNNNSIVGQGNRLDRIDSGSRSVGTNSASLPKIELVDHKNNLYLITGFGDSMRPTFENGDKVIFDASIKRMNCDGLYVFRIDSDLFIKRLQRIPTEHGIVIRALSENKNMYLSFDIPKNTDFEILGKVIQTWVNQKY